ncbi:hypothetical protein OUZ56_032114 [Daphnia magna]|uniref:CCHC-type domain-containing protein n=1 Tax=Daphnia magna TaxID=35525 RepID=A0ABQ9ZWA4_9CRUS|nr:hypothetical protein OUZ56_032114 [Daphnia magna]
MSAIGSAGDVSQDYMVIDIPEDKIQLLSHAHLIALVQRQSQLFRTAIKREKSAHDSEHEAHMEEDRHRRFDVRPRRHSEVPEELERYRDRECRCPINVSCLDKMAGDISYRDFFTWRNKWDDFCNLQRIAEYPKREQACMTLSLEMLQTVEMIERHVRKNRRLALDRFEFKEYRQERSATFDEFYIVNVLKKPDEKGNRSRTHSLRRGEYKDRPKCGNCGHPPHDAGKDCPAKGRDCHSCGKSGHFSTVFEKHKDKSEKQVASCKKLASICLAHIAAARHAPTIEVGIHSRSGEHLYTATAIPDTGAEATVASMAILQLLGEDVNNLLQRGVDNLTAANNSSLKCAGRLVLQLHYRGRSDTTSV